MDGESGRTTKGDYRSGVEWWLCAVVVTSNIKSQIQHQNEHNVPTTTTQ